MFYSVGCFWSTPAVHAQQREVQINFVNAGTCDFNPASEPNSFIATAGAFIAGRNAVAFCSIPSPFTDLFSDLFELDEILYTGRITAPGAITAQVCVYISSPVFMLACSPESTPERTGNFAQRLRPPQVGFPSLGAFLIVRFSDRTLSFVYQMRSAWGRATLKAPAKLLKNTLPSGQVASNAVASASRPDPTVLEPFRDKKAQQQVTDYLLRLDQALEQENREEPWATDMETRLRNSFVGAGLGSGTLDSVECRSSQCQLKIQPGGDPVEVITQQAKVSKWLGGIMNCEYTTVAGESNSDNTPIPVRIYIKCGNNSGEERQREK